MLDSSCILAATQLSFVRRRRLYGLDAIFSIYVSAKNLCRKNDKLENGGGIAQVGTTLTDTREVTRLGCELKLGWNGLRVTIASKHAILCCHDNVGPFTRVVVLVCSINFQLDNDVRFYRQAIWLFP